jgi:alpha-N-arabinofuranosidase
VDEFTAWARRASVEPMMAVNLGTRGVQEAVDLLEYCNVPAGTLLSDLRGSNGSPHRPPHGPCCGWARPSTVAAMTERR